MMITLNTLKNNKNVLSKLNVTEKNPICIGLDLHKTNIWVAAVQLQDGKPELIFSNRIAIPNNKEDFIETMSAFNEYPCVTTVESTYNWYWIADLFEDNNWELLIANPQTVLHSNLKNSNDKTDAICLAKHLSTGSLQYTKPLPKKARYFRALNRDRMTLVKQRSEVKTRIIEGFANFICEHINGKSVDILATQMKKDPKNRCLENSFTNEYQIIHMKSLFIELLFLEKRIEDIEKKQKELLKQFDDNNPVKEMAQNIRQNYGCGEVITMTLCTEVGDISRFKESKNFVSYCRLSPTSRVSNGKCKGSGNPKNGNAYLSWVFSEWANYLTVFDSFAKSYYQKLLRKTGNIRAKALRIFAAKLCRGLWYSLTNKEPFDLKRCLGYCNAAV